MFWDPQQLAEESPVGDRSGAGESCPVPVPSPAQRDGDFPSPAPSKPVQRKTRDCCVVAGGKYFHRSKGSNTQLRAARFAPPYSLKSVIGGKQESDNVYNMQYV